ncbi:MAG: ATP-binding protein [Alphaproteobacteria bacterium]
MKFIGRNHDLATLRGLLSKRSASLVVVKGRRRIGKSRLIKEFAKDFTFVDFSGAPPSDKSTEQTQRDDFAHQLEKKFKLPRLKSDDWGDLFTALAQQTAQGRVVILLDEISWMGGLDPAFLGKLKNAWDMEFSNNPNLILFLCGSVSSWIEKNIINSTGFVGRPSLYLTLEELTLSDCNQFWGPLGEGISAYEKLKLLSVIGGIPRYLELMNPQESAEENIKKLCFTRNSPLKDEFDHIFTDIFSNRSALYKNILFFLSKGRANQNEIADAVGLPRTGDLSDYLNDLMLGGFISRDYTWSIKTGHISKLSSYRLKDCYSRFYLKYILAKKPLIDKDTFALRGLSSLPGWDGMMGLQFENLVLNNHKRVLQLLEISPEDVVFENPFFQTKTTRHRGCQIDYLVQTRFDTVYPCEIKFSRTEVGLEVVEQVRQKIKNIALPRHVSYRPVLIHVNGVSEEVYDSGFFANIIDFSSFLQDHLPPL